MQSRKRLTDIGQNLQLPKRKRGRGGINLEFGIRRYKLLPIKTDEQQLPTVGNSIQHFVIKHNEKESEKVNCLKI